MANEADVELESPFIDYKEKAMWQHLKERILLVTFCAYKIKLISSSNDTATYFFSTNDFSLLKKQAVSKNAELDNNLLDTITVIRQLLKE